MNNVHPVVGLRSQVPGKEPDDSARFRMRDGSVGLYLRVRADVYRNVFGAGLPQKRMQMETGHDLQNALLYVMVGPVYRITSRAPPRYSSLAAQFRRESAGCGSSRPPPAQWKVPGTRLAPHLAAHPLLDQMDVPLIPLAPGVAWCARGWPVHRRALLVAGFLPRRDAPPVAGLLAACYW